MSCLFIISPKYKILILCKKYFLVYVFGIEGAATKPNAPNNVQKNIATTLGLGLKKSKSVNLNI